MHALTHIQTTFGIGQPADRIINLPISRWTEFPDLLRELEVKRMVEVGTYKGKYAEALMERIPELDLTAVDPWLAYDGYEDYERNDLEVNAYAQARGRAERCGFKILREISLAGAKKFEDGSLDAVFIDANHDFEHVVADVATWSRKVKGGGIVSGHDFFKNHRKRFGVFEALPAWCEANDIPHLFVTKKDKCPTWFYVKP